MGSEVFGAPPADRRTGVVAAFLAADHARLDALLEGAGQSDPIDWCDYVAFRAGLLKHIGMEEKILLPAAQAARGGRPLPVAAQLRLDHGALAALLVPTPSAAILRALRTILTAHNAIEEAPGGVYETCEQLLGADAGALLARLRAAGDVPLHPNVDGPRIMTAARRALDRAGYESLVI